MGLENLIQDTCPGQLPNSGLGHELELWTHDYSRDPAFVAGIWRVSGVSSVWKCRLCWYSVAFPNQSHGRIGVVGVHEWRFGASLPFNLLGGYVEFSLDWDWEFVGRPEIVLREDLDPDEARSGHYLAVPEDIPWGEARSGQCLQFKGQLFVGVFWLGSSS